MTPYAHVSELTRTVHDALIGWARVLLQKAELETVEVYGQFPPEGTVSSHMVLFPYWVGPQPKLVEQGSPISLFRPPKVGDGKVSFVPVGWRRLGEVLNDEVETWFSMPGPLTGVKFKHFPHPTLEKLPKAEVAWYRAQEKARDEKEEMRPWVIERDGKKYAPPPALMWKPGIQMVIRYIAVASDPGRGTSQYSSTGAPLSLPALSVLATGVHIERRVKMQVNPPPMPEDLKRFIKAVLASTKGDAKKRLQEVSDLLQTPEEIGIAISPVDDLTNQEFALLMQALQRPLQAALNFQMRVVLGARPVFEPGMVTRARPPRPTPDFHVDDGSG